MHVLMIRGLLVGRILPSFGISSPMNWDDFQGCLLLDESLSKTSEMVTWWRHMVLNLWHRNRELGV